MQKTTRRTVLARGVRVAAAVLAASLLAIAPAQAREAFHLRLVSSDPAPNGTVAGSPAAIHLTFTEAPELRVTSVRLADARGAAVALGALRAERGPTVSAAVRRPLIPGVYYVRWRTMSHDGHVMRGSVRFVVAAASHAHPH